MRPTLPAFGLLSRFQTGHLFRQGLFGLAPRRDCPFHPSPAKISDGQRLVSVALILPSRGAGVTRSAALWSPDFPPRPYLHGGAAIRSSLQFPIIQYRRGIGSGDSPATLGGPVAGLPSLGPLLGRGLASLRALGWGARWSLWSLGALPATDLWRVDSVSTTLPPALPSHLMENTDGTACGTRCAHPHPEGGPIPAPRSGCGVSRQREARSGHGSPVLKSGESEGFALAQPDTLGLASGLRIPAHEWGADTLPHPGGVRNSENPRT